MRRFMIATLLAAVVLPVAKRAHSADAHSERERLQRFIKAMRPKFARLSQQYGPDFDRLMRDLTAAASLDCFFQTDDHPRESRLYREFVVQSLDNSLRGDVGESMFAALVLSVSPPRVVLEAIAPELGADGCLHRLLEQPSHDVFRHIQKETSQGDGGRPSFDQYVVYLRDGSRRGIAEQPNAELLVAHMFKTDVQEAFLAMLRIEYGLQPESNYVYVNVARQARKEVRDLQLMRHEVGDYLFHRRYSFPTPPSLKDRVETHLGAASRDTRWWVRLYVAQIMRQHAELRQPDIVARLVDDDHPLVREALQFAREPRNKPAKAAEEKATTDPKFQGG